MLKKDKQNAFVLAEGMVSILLISTCFFYQSISLHQNLTKLNQEKNKLESQRIITNQEYLQWQEKMHSR